MPANSCSVYILRVVGTLTVQPWCVSVPVGPWVVQVGVGKLRRVACVDGSDPPSFRNRYDRVEGGMTSVYVLEFLLGGSGRAGGRSKYSVPCILVITKNAMTQTSLYNTSLLVVLGNIVQNLIRTKKQKKVLTVMINVDK